MGDTRATNPAPEIKPLHRFGFRKPTAFAAFRKTPQKVVELFCRVELRRVAAKLPGFDPLMDDLSDAPQSQLPPSARAISLEKLESAPGWTAIVASMPASAPPR